MIADAAAESGRTPCSPGACRAGSCDAMCETVHAGFKLTADSFFYFILIFFLDLCVFTYFGQFLVFLTPSQGMAQIIASGEHCLPLICIEQTGSLAIKHNAAISLCTEKSSPGHGLLAIGHLHDPMWYHELDIRT
jgi:hypothetical protein